MTAPLDKAPSGAPPSAGTPPEAINAIPVRHHGRYVSAENGGAAPLIANRTSIGPWEKFDLVT